MVMGTGGNPSNFLVLIGIAGTLLVSHHYTCYCNNTMNRYRYVMSHGLLLGLDYCVMVCFTVMNVYGGPMLHRGVVLINSL